MEIITRKRTVWLTFLDVLYKKKLPLQSIHAKGVPFFVTPERFTRNEVNYAVCQYFRFLENHGCSLFAHPDISMFFVYLQRKSSYNSLISGCFQR